MRGNQREKPGERLLDEYLQAWNRHDIDGIMAYMCDDCVYEASSGPDPWGKRFVGLEQVRQAFSAVWALMPDAAWGNAKNWACGDKGVSEWTFTGTRPDSTRVEVEGCDLYAFREGKIALKKTFLKNRPPSAAR